jgi:hypothetical protein
MVRTNQEPKTGSCSRRTSSIGVGMYDEMTLVHEGGRVAISNEDLNYQDRKWTDTQFGISDHLSTQPHLLQRADPLGLGLAHFTQVF